MDEPLTYVPGSAVAVCAPGIAVLLEADAPADLVAALFAVLRGSGELDDVLDEIVRPGLRAIHSFAAAQWSDAGTRVVVRGDFVGHPDQGEDVLGRGLWTDRFVPAGCAVRLDSGDGGDGEELPLVCGVVRAGRIGTAPEAGYASPAIRESTDQPAVVSLEKPEASSTDQPAAAAQEQSDGSPVEPGVALAYAVLAAAPTKELPAEAPTEHDAAAEPAEEPPATPVPFVPEQAEEPWVTPGPAPTLTPAVPVAASTPVPPPVSPASGAMLIESFPWASDQYSAASPLQPADPWSQPVSPAAPAAEQPVASAWSGPDDEAFEMTVDRSRLVQRSSEQTTMVVAARCPRGHLSPAYAGVCRVCGQPLPPQQPFEVARPTLGLLRLSNGDVVMLDRGVVMGRNPRLPAGYSGEQPNLVKLQDPNKDVSSQHLEVSLDYWHVLVSDLGSTNGTEVILPGRPAVQLRPNDPMMIEPGTRVIIAGVMDFVYEVLG